MTFISGWYVIYTKPRHEKTVTSKLLQNNFKVYLPLVKTVVQWSDRKKKVEKPLFHSYVFVYLDTQTDYLNILNIRGVVCFIQVEKRLARVRDIEIITIKKFLKQFSEIEINNTQNLAIGEKRTITCGVFKNYECEILQIANQKKICVRIDSIKMNLIASFHPSYLE